MIFCSGKRDILGWGKGKRSCGGGGFDRLQQRRGKHSFLPVSELGAGKKERELWSEAWVAVTGTKQRGWGAVLDQRGPFFRLNKERLVMGARSSRKKKREMMKYR